MNAKDLVESIHQVVDKFLDGAVTADEAMNQIAMLVGMRED